MFGIKRKKTLKDRVFDFADHSSDVADAAKQVAAVGTDLQVIVQKEIASAKDEILSELKKAPVGFGMMSTAPFLAFFALLLLSFAAVYGLAEVLAVPYAFLIVGGIYSLLAGIMFLVGKRKVKSINLVPTETMKSTKQEVSDLVKSSL